MGTKIQDFADQQKADLDAISSSVSVVVEGIKKLDDMITAFQNSPGTLSAEDESAIAAIQSQTKSLRDQVESINVTPPEPLQPVSAATEPSRFTDTKGQQKPQPAQSQQNQPKR